MLNYFVFPGFTDTWDELDALSAWIEEDGVDMLQLRNLNIDPELYMATLGEVIEHGEPMGVLPWLAEVQRRHPHLRFGYFNPPRSSFDEDPAELRFPVPGESDAHL